MIKLYTCMDCKLRSPDDSLFRIVTTGVVGVVVCNECLGKW